MSKKTDISKNYHDDNDMTVPVVVHSSDTERDHRVHEQRKIVREEKVDLDKIIEGAGTKFFVTGERVEVGFRELLDLAAKHDLGQILDVERESVTVSSKLLTGMARADVIDEEDPELQYIDAIAVGLFLGGFLLGLIALFMSDGDLKTAAWVILLLSVAMLSSYAYQGIKTGFLKKMVKKYLAKMAKGK